MRRSSITKEEFLIGCQADYDRLSLLETMSGMFQLTKRRKKTISLFLTNSEKRDKTEPEDFGERYHAASQAEAKEATNVADQTNPEQNISQFIA